MMRLIIIGGFYTTAGAGFKFFLVFLRFGFLEVRLCLTGDFLFFSDRSQLMECSSSRHTLQNFDGLLSLSLLFKAVLSLFIKYRI